MQIRMWNAFASNNSGSYTLVGTFADEEHARALAEELEAVLVAQHRWVEAQRATHAHPPSGEDANAAATPKTDAPLHAFARREGCASVDAFEPWDEPWPSGSDPPEVVASGAQILVHVPLTITMPRVLGELIYRRGGRVSAELDHTHHPLLLRLEVWPSWKLEKSEREARLSAFAAAIEGDALGAALVPRRYEQRPAWPPAVRWPDWGMLEVTIAPTDLVLAVRLARGLATTHGVALRTHVYEASSDKGDPLAPLRTLDREEGGFQVILWSAGPDAVRSLRAVHEVIGGTVAEARAKLAAAPVELSLAVSQDEAYTSFQILQSAGCEAEVVRPKGH